MPKFEKGNAFAKLKTGKQNERTALVKDLMASFNKKAMPKLLARIDELPIEKLASIVAQFQNYIDPPAKKLAVTHNHPVEAPKEIQALPREALEAMMRIMNGEQPTFEIQKQIELK